MKLMEHKGYYGSIEASVEDGCLFGKLEFIGPLVNYEGETVDEINSAFKAAVEDYLETCKRQDVKPSKPYRGSFNIRVGHNLHRAAVIAAKQRNMKLNELVKLAIEREVANQNE